jgi:riboflavin synthase
MEGSSFSVAVIPETLKRTTLGQVKTGDVVNIETDIITKTIKKQLEKILPQKQTLTEEKLKQLGF